MASASRGKNVVPKEITDQFCAITGATSEIADGLLEACNGNLEMAIGMHMDGAGGGSQDPIPTPGSPPAACGSGSATSQPADALDDDVRAPIPQRREVLVQDLQANFGTVGNYGRRRTPRSVFDGLRDFQAEARQQQEAAQADVPKSEKQKTLEDLFRPPIDLMFKGSFHAARDAGTAANRWLLVNVQNAKEFQCQMLNRDVWSNASVKSLVNDSFIFWQVYNDSEEGRKYMQFYKIDVWPYIAILDPRTGENLVTWTNVDAITLCDLMTEYLAEHQRPDGVVSPDGPPTKRARKDSIIEASEDSQIQAAIRASMEENKPKRSPDPIVIDSGDEDYGSDADLETFSDSEDELNNAPVKKPTAKSIDSNTNSSSESGSHSAPGNEDRVDDARHTIGEVQLVSESSSSSSSSGVTPATIEPVSTPFKSTSTPSSSNKPTTYITTSSSSSSSSSATASSSLASSSKQTDLQNHRVEKSNTSTSSSSGIASASSSGCSAESKDCLNGSDGDTATGPTNSTLSSSSSTNGTVTNDSNTTEPYKKFQFVQQSTAAVSLSSWRDHLGSDSDSQTVINIRFPDGKRQQFKVPCSTKLRALVMFVQEEGYHKEMYELVTIFPKRKLSYLDIEDTLRNHGLFPQETVFVQER